MIKNDWNHLIYMNINYTEKKEEETKTQTLGYQCAPSTVWSRIWLDLKHNYSMRILSVSSSRLQTRVGTALEQLWYKKFINSVKCCVTTCHMSTADIYYWGTWVLPKPWVVQWAIGGPQCNVTVSGTVLKKKNEAKQVWSSVAQSITLLFQCIFMIIPKKCQAPNSQIF